MPLTQAAAQHKFGEALRLADVWKKTEVVYARYAQEPETITANDGQWIVLNLDQEVYTMEGRQFSARYKPSQRAVPRRLRAEGFQLFEPQGSVRAHFLTQVDLDKFPNRALKPKDGDALVVAVGGVLAKSTEPGHDEVYYIPKDVFERTYVKTSQRRVGKTERWRERAYLAEPENSRVLPNVDGFATQAKVLLPEADKVSEACVRPAIGHDPGYLVVTTKPGLRLLVFDLGTFALKLDKPLAAINRTSPTPFCSLHHRDASLLHVSFMVVKWQHLASTFGREDAILVSDTTESRFAVFSPNFVVSKGSNGDLVSKGLWANKSATKLRTRPEGDLDPRMVASAEEDVVFVVATTASNLRTLNAINITNQTIRTRKLQPEGLLLSFAIHPEWLFVVHAAGVDVLEQKTLDAVFDIPLVCDPRSFRVMFAPATRADEYLPTIVANHEQACQVYKAGDKYPTLALGKLPPGWRIVAVHEGGMVVGDSRGHLMGLLKSSHPLVPLDRRSSVLVCPDPASSRLVIVDTQANKLLFFQQCQVRDRGPFKTGHIGPGARAMCVDWSQGGPDASRAFVADAEEVGVFSLSTMGSVASVGVEHVDGLCVAHRRQELFLHCEGKDEVLGHDLNTLERKEVISICVGPSVTLMPLGDGEVAAVGPGEGMRHVQTLGRDGEVSLQTDSERLGSAQGRFVFASSVVQNTIEDVDGNVVYVAKGHARNFVVFVTEVKVRTGGGDDKRWCVCRLKIRDPPAQAEGEGEGEGEEGEGGEEREERGLGRRERHSINSVVRLASFNDKVTECFVLKDVVVVRCANRVCVINLGSNEGRLAAHDFLNSHEPQQLLDGDGNDRGDVVRAMARGQELFWLQMLRKKANLDVALKQAKLRLLPVIPMSDILSMILEHRAKEEQRGLVQVVLEAYVEHLQRHNDRRLGLGGAKPGWEVDFQTMDEGFLGVLLALVDNFPRETAKFLGDLPLARLNQRDEDRVFRHGVPPQAVEAADHRLVVGSSDFLDEMEWGGGGAQPKTVGDYVVPFPSHSSNGDDLLVHIARHGTARFVRGAVLRTVIAHRWRSFARGVHILRLARYLCAVALVVAMTFLDPPSDPRWVAVFEFAGLGALIAGAVAQRLVEWKYVGWTFRQFCTNPFDVLALVRILLTLACMAVYFPAAAAERGSDWEAAFRFLVGALAYMQWFGVLRFLQPFRAFASSIHMMTHIAWDVKHFLVVLLVTVLAASNALFGALLPRERSGHFSNPGTAVFSAFRITVLADVAPVDEAAIADESREWVVRVVVIVSSLVVTVVLLNLMIAAMTYRFEIIQGRAEVELLVLRVESILRQQAHHGRLMRWMRFAFSVAKQPSVEAPGRTTRAGSNRSLQRPVVPWFRRLAGCVSWPVREQGRVGLRLFYAVPVERFLRLTNARPSVLYDAWLHVLVPHDKAAHKATTPAQLSGALRDIWTRLDGLDESKLEAKIDKTSQDVADLKAQLGEVLALLRERHN